MLKGMLDCVKSGYVAGLMTLVGFHFVHGLHVLPQIGVLLVAPVVGSVLVHLSHKLMGMFK